MDASKPRASGSSEVVDVDTSSSTRVQHLKEVWEDNAFEEVNKIRNLLKRYNHFSVAVKHFGNIDEVQEEEGRREILHDYKTVRRHATHFPVIQIAITLFDADGKVDYDNCVTWQFNMELASGNSLVNDKIREAGFDIDNHQAKGVKHRVMSELLIFNRMVLNKELTWVGFNSAYEFAYLVKILNGAPLPEEESKFLQDVREFFPLMYDVRCLMTVCSCPSGPLDWMADRMNLQRVYPPYYAASDSRLIGRLFFKLKSAYLSNKIDDQFCCRIYNLGLVKSDANGHNEVR